MRFTLPFVNLAYTTGLLICVSLMMLIPTGIHAQCINTFPYVENFDSGPGGWTASAPGATGWSLGTPTKSIINAPSSAPNSWVTGTLFSNYSNNANSHVTSPCFDFSNLSNPALSMNIWWESEFSFDGAVLAASTDSGMTFNVVGGFLDPVNWYNDNSVNGGFTGGPCNQGLGWTGQVGSGNGSQGWLTAQHLLDGLAGQASVILRICFASDFSTAGDGFAFDDIVIADAPVVDLGPNKSMCFGDSLVLNACVGSAQSYSWNTSPIDTFCTNTISATNQYIVVVTDTLGFIVRDTIDVFVSSTNVSLPPDQLICPGDTFFLDAGNPGATHIWEPGNIMTQTLNVSQTGSYKVTVSDNFGCVKVDSIDIVVDVVPVVDLGADTTICIGESILLDAGAGNPGTTYDWNFNGATTQTIIVSAPGLYKVDVITIGGCLEQDSMMLGVSLSPVIDLGPDRVECGTFTLDALNTGAAYLWSNNATTQTITTANSGTYWVRVTNSFNCFDTDTVQISLGSTPTVNLGPDRVICNGSTTTLDLGNPGQTYFWSNGDVTQTTVVGSPGLVIGQVTNGDGCSASDSVMVTLSPLVVNLGPDLTVCDGDSTMLDAGTLGQTYMWSTGEVTPVIYPTTGGTYIATVTDSANCVAKDTVVLTARPDFAADYSVTDSAVLYQTLQFTDMSGGNPNIWLWDFGDGNTSTLQNPMHAFQAVQVYQVCLTASDGVCTNTVCKDVEVSIFTDLEEELGLKLDLYPNPSKGTFKLEFQLDVAADIELAVLDTRGRALWQEIPGTRSFYSQQIAMPGIARGIYLFRMKIDGQDIFRKIIIR